MGATIPRTGHRPAEGLEFGEAKLEVKLPKVMLSLSQQNANVTDCVGQQKHHDSEQKFPGFKIYYALHIRIL